MTDLVDVLAPVICDQEPYCKGLAGTGCSSAPPCFAIIQTRAILTALEKSGYRVVPVEPTEAMLTAGYVGGPDDDAPIHELEAHWATLSPEDIWPAMLAAAPKITTGG